MPGKYEAHTEKEGGKEKIPGSSRKTSVGKKSFPTSNPRADGEFKGGGMGEKCNHAPGRGHGTVF